MNASYRIAKLTKSDKSRFMEMMGGAFAADPLFLHLFGDSERDSGARRRVTAFVSFIFDKSFMLREEAWGLFEAGKLLGAYAAEKPLPQARKLAHIKEGMLLSGRLIPLFFRLPLRTIAALNDYMRVTRSAAPASAHHYLIMIGVAPGQQGNGIGQALLEHLLNRAAADLHSHGVALDTENKLNVDWYRKFGFQLHKETHVRQLPVYCLFRPR